MRISRKKQFDALRVFLKILAAVELHGAYDTSSWITVLVKGAASTFPRQPCARSNHGMHSIPTMDM